MCSKMNLSKDRFDTVRRNPYSTIDIHIPVLAIKENICTITVESHYNKIAYSECLSTVYFASPSKSCKHTI